MAIKIMNTSAAGGEPAASTLLERAAQRGHNPGTVTAALLRLLDRYGAAALEAAIVSALAQGVPPLIYSVKDWLAEVEAPRARIRRATFSVGLGAGGLDDLGPLGGLAPDQLAVAFRRRRHDVH